MFIKLEDAPGFIINKTALAMKNELEKNLKDFDLTAVQFAILKTLWEQDGLNQKEISNRTFKTTAEITHLIDKLVSKGFVVRETNEQDKREYKIKLTLKGLQLEQTAMNGARNALTKALNGVASSDLKIALSVCDQIFNNLYDVSQ